MNRIEKPKAPGFYWFRGNAKGYYANQDTIVEVKFDACFGDPPYVWLLGTDESPELSLFEGEWYGPLEPPEFLKKNKTADKTRTFLMDGTEHEAPNKLTGCCNAFGKKCGKCGGFMHYQAVRGGYFYECEDCHEKEY